MQIGVQTCLRYCTELIRYCCAVVPTFPKPLGTYSGGHDH